MSKEDGNVWPVDPFVSTPKAAENAEDGHLAGQMHAAMRAKNRSTHTKGRSVKHGRIAVCFETAFNSNRRRTRIRKGL